MKNLIPILLVAALVPGCKSPYDYMENWLIREDAVRPFSVPVDVIYVQDQLYDSMNALPEMQAIAMDAVGRGKLNGFARVFSPLVASEDDVEKAVEWYLKASNQGNVDAMNNLGFMYEKGEGVEQNWQKAADMYQKAADKGDAWAQHNIGLCYYQGTGVTKNNKEAAKWFQKSAEQGNESARRWLQTMSMNGELY